MHNSIQVADLPAAAVVIVVAVAGALPAYWTLRRAKPGRARAAVAYLLGFVAGLLATTMLGVILEPLAWEETPLAVVGMMASFIGPLVGMVHAKLSTPPRRKSRATGPQWGFQR